MQNETFPINIYHVSDATTSLSEEENTLECMLLGHMNLIYDLHWSEDDTRLLSASSDGTARLWDTKQFSAASVKTLPHPCFVYCARFRPGPSARHRSQAVTGAFDGIVRIWNLDIEGPVAEQLQELNSHRANVNSIIFQGDGMRMYTGDGRGSILLWAAEAGPANDDDDYDPALSEMLPWENMGVIAEQEIKDDAITKLEMHPNGKFILVHARDNIIRLMDLRSELFIQRYKGAQNANLWTRSCFSACGTFIIGGSSEGHAFAWSTETGEQIYVYKRMGIKEGVSDVIFHPKDHILAFASFGTSQPILLYHYEPGSEPISALPTLNQTMLSQGGGGTSRLGASYSPNKLKQSMAAMSDSANRLNTIGQAANERLAGGLDSTLSLTLPVGGKVGELAPQADARDDARTEMADLVAERERVVEAVLDSTAGAIQRRRDDLMKEADTEVPVMATILARSKAGGGPGNRTEALPTSPTKFDKTAADLQSAMARELGADAADTSAAPPPPPPPAMYRAKFQYNRRREDELSFEAGDVIAIEQKREKKAWWYGRLDRDPRQAGMVPVNYIEPAAPGEGTGSALSYISDPNNYAKKVAKLNTTSNPPRSSMHLPAKELSATLVKVAGSPATRRRRAAGGGAQLDDYTADPAVTKDDQIAKAHSTLSTARRRRLTRMSAEKKNVYPKNGAFPSILF